MPCLHETRLREVNVIIFTIANATQYNRNVNLPRVNVSRVNTAKDWPQQKLPKFGFRSHTSAYNCTTLTLFGPVARQRFSLVSTAYDWILAFISFDALHFSRRSSSNWISPVLSPSRAPL